MSQVAKIISYVVFIAFVGAVLGCSFTATSAHLGILNDNVAASEGASTSIDPLKGAVTVTELELEALLAALVLVLGFFWHLSSAQHRYLILRGSLLNRWQVRSQHVLARLYDHFLTLLRSGILQPNIY